MKFRTFREGEMGTNIKQLCSPVKALLRNYSSSSGSSSPRWLTNKFMMHNRENSGMKDPPKPRTSKIKWTEEQSQVLSEISKGKSVFVSGSAGTGKTVLVEHIIKQLKRIHGRSKVFVTASTGVAACALHGMTLHCFSGTGVSEDDQENILFTVLKNKKACSRWNKVKALVIDEISMISATYFEKLEFIARNIRDNNHVWGGIQLVVSGDFFQLPPISSKHDDTYKEYAFEADCWDLSFNFQIELAKVFRQSDAHLVKLLQGIRRGESDSEDLKLLEKCYALPDDDPTAVQLFPRIDDVSRVNKTKLLSLNSGTVVYNALDTGDDPWLKQLNSGISPKRLELCIGARVMLCKNINTFNKLVNGATGTVVGFVDVSAKNDSDVKQLCSSSNACFLPLVKFDFGKKYIVEVETWYVRNGENKVAERKQIPLILAWALSVHKCQGMTLDRLHTDLSRAFGCGMVYVALSRVRTLDGLHLSGFCPYKIKADPKVLHFYKNFSKNHDT